MTCFEQQKSEEKHDFMLKMTMIYRAGTGVRKIALIFDLNEINVVVVPSKNEQFM